MKALSPIRLLLVAAVVLAIAPVAEARDGRGNSGRGEYRRGGDHSNHYHGNRGYNGYRGGNRYYRSNFGYYRPRYYSGFGYGYGGYYGTGLSVAISPGYSTSYYSDDDRPIYRGRQIRENSSDSNSLEVLVQKKLGRLGYYSGEYDGDIGPASRRAILKYQRENDLPETGTIDRSLVKDLDLS